MGLDKYMRGNALIHLLGANHGKLKYTKVINRAV